MARPWSGSALPTSACSSASRSDFVHTDPWRVLRIQAEFVDGFDALAGVGPAVSVFGSARADRTIPTTRARERGAGLAEAGSA